MSMEQYIIVSLLIILVLMSIWHCWDNARNNGLYKESQRQLRYLSRKLQEARNPENEPEIYLEENEGIIIDQDNITIYGIDGFKPFVRIKVNSPNQSTTTEKGK